MITATLRAKGEESVVHFLEDAFFIGSAHDCNILVIDAAPRQCKIQRDAEGRYSIRDLTGMEETLVNGKSVAEHVFEPGDTLKIGSQEFVFDVEEGAPVADDPSDPPVVKVEAPRRRRPTTRRVKPVTERAVVRVASVKEEKTLKTWAYVCAAFLGLLILLIVVPMLSPGSRNPSPEDSEPVARTKPVAVRRTPTPQPMTAPKGDVPGPMPKESGVTSPKLPPVSLPSNASPQPAAPLRPTPKNVSSPSPSATVNLSAAMEILRDPGRRAAEGTRADAARALKEIAGQSVVAAFLAYYLSLPEDYWKCGENPAWAGYLARLPLDELARMTPDRHASFAGELLDGGGRNELCRSAALAHLVETGHKDRLLDAGFRATPDGKTWGDVDQIAQMQIVEALTAGGEEESAAEKSALESPNFSVRYPAVLLRLQRAFEGKYSCKQTFDLIVGLRSGPGNAGKHMSALAVGFKQLVTCRACKGGQVTCPTCRGIGRADQICPICKGHGWVRSIYAIGKADLKMKCPACGGHKEFKDWPCFTCAKKGQVDCSSCGGKYWLDVCPNCILGRATCPTCRGTKREIVTCSICNGTGLMPSIQRRMAEKGWKQKCRNCENASGKGGIKCGFCKATGTVTCAACGGTAKSASFRATARDLYDTSECRVCDGRGRPVPGLAIPCASCVGLGYVVQPGNSRDETLFKPR